MIRALIGNETMSVRCASVVGMSDIDGTSVGSPVGCSVGSFVGDNEGIDVGDNVGPDVGSVVGRNKRGTPGDVTDG